MKLYRRKYNDRDIFTIWRPIDLEIKPITQASGVCINNKGQILIIKAKDEWHLPGGHPEKKESLEETLKREVLEEACVEIINCSLLGYSEIFFPENPNQKEGEHFFQVRFVAFISKILPLRPDPATGIIFERKFINPKDFTKYIRWQDAKELIDSCMKFIDKINLK